MKKRGAITKKLISQSLIFLNCLKINIFIVRQRSERGSGPSRFLIALSVRRSIKNTLNSTDYIIKGNNNMP